MFLGMRELFIVLIISVIWLIPLAALVWALITLHRIRIGQDAIRLRLDDIERSLQRTGTH